jgi:hypothetical protein
LNEVDDFCCFTSIQLACFPPWLAGRFHNFELTQNREKTRNGLISQSFHVNLTYSGSVVWRRFLNDPTPFLHFCDYLLFEENLALYFNNLESPLPKEDLYQL